MDTIQLSHAPQVTKNPVGRPQKNTNEELITKAEAYYKRCVQPTKDGKIRIPYVQELAVELDITRETIYERMETSSELSYTVKKILNLQQLRLLNRTMSKMPAGAIFQLKANHGMADRIDMTSNGEKIDTGPTVIIKSNEQ